MRAHRFVATGLATLALATSAATVAPAQAAPSHASSTTATQSVSHHRVVRAAQVRRHAGTARATNATRTSTLSKITTAVRRSEYTAGVPASSYAVTVLRTSGSWARVTLQPGKSVELDPATVVLRQTKGQWKVVDLGTAMVGCDVAPKATVKALRLDCE